MQETGRLFQQVLFLRQARMRELLNWHSCPLLRHLPLPG